MNPEVEIRIVVAIAAVLVLFSLVLCVAALRHDAQRGERFGFAWLFMTNLAFLTATLGLMGAPGLPFWLGAALVISGAHLGIIFGYFALRAGLGERTSMRRYGAFAALAIGGQAGLALVLNDIDVLVLTSSVVNGLMSIHMARRIWPLARRFGAEVAALSSLPFAAIASAYLFRLPLLALDASATTVTVATLVISFLLAFSALQWAFALLAFRAARLNARLEAERLRAEEANRLKSRFLANMSHELRTPLNGILGMAQVLQGLVGDDEQRRMAETIRTSGDGLMAILNDILDLSKIEAGKMELERAPFRPADVMERIGRLHTPQAESRGLALGMRCDPALEAAFVGDGHRLTQVLNNLVANAVKFTEAGRIELHGEATEDGVRIIVTDTGIGMSDAQLARVFNAFAQADVSVTRRFGGTGLGLPIVQRLITMMGGTLTLDSAPGAGTRATLELPLEPARDSAPPRALPPDAGRGDLGGLRVLVAEDNLTNQKVLAALLRGSGAELTMVGNGREALEAALGGDFDLFLFDVSMPEMDGTTALRGIEAAFRDAGRTRPPAAAITANVMPEQLSEYAAAGFATCLAKPLRKAALNDCIAALTGATATARPSASHGGAG